VDTIDEVKGGLAVSEVGQINKFEDFPSVDFVFAGPMPEPVGKREFVGLMTAKVPGGPDWKFNGKDFKQIGDKVVVTFQITGTQTRELNLPMTGIPKISASVRHISLPKEPTEITVKNGKMSQLESAVVSGGGVIDVLTQLGVARPKMA
jgi:hypothetical protein